MELESSSSGRRFYGTFDHAESSGVEDTPKRKVKKAVHAPEVVQYPIIKGSFSRVVVADDEKVFDPFDDSLLSEKEYTTKYPFGRLECHTHCKFASRKFADVNMVFRLDKFVGGRQCVCLGDPAHRREIAEKPYLLYLDDIRAAFDYRSRELYEGQKVYPLNYFISVVAKAAVLAVLDINEMLEGDCATPNCSTKAALSYQGLHLMRLVEITGRAEVGTPGPFGTIFCKDGCFYSSTLRKQTE